MTAVVITFNLILAAGCWYVVFKICQFRRSTRNFRRSVLDAEEHCRYHLAIAPEAILAIQTQTSQWRFQQYEWQQRILALQYWLKLLTMVQRLMRLYAQLYTRQR